jgi:ATP-binding cassette subfamily F protein uup
MAILQCRDLNLSYGDTPLLEAVSVGIEPGDRICLLGRNGTGKSTFLKVLTGEVSPDKGEVSRQTGLRIATLVQAVPENQDKNIFEVVAEGSLLQELDPDLDSKSYWQVRSQVDALLSQMNLDPEVSFSGLSGGMKRRVLLAQAIIGSPDLLILDEPTNHLDIEAIEWLENFLLGYKKAILFVSHDRSFVRKMATRIFDLDRGVLSVFAGNYDAYLVHKAEALHAEDKAWERFDKKLAEEEIWIRQGVKARRTRNEGRVLALENMRRERMARHDRMGKADFTIDDTVSSGKKVIEAKNISYAFGEGASQKKIVENFSITLHKGDKIGFVGPNGVGKSTLIQLLLKELSPQSGSVNIGTSVEIAYLNQLRLGINPESTVFEAISEGGKEFISVAGVDKHIYSYLQEFLFAPTRVRAKVKVLSGGELNRLLLAKLFTKPANLLVLDEPTNDLDMETLELLEELLVNYQGTLLLVSHDRAFLNNIVTSTLVAEGEGNWKEYLGGYDDYLAQYRRQKSLNLGSSDQKSELKPKALENIETQKPKKNKLSFIENKELEGLPDQITQLENQLAMESEKASPESYQKLAELNQNLEVLLARWETLEAKKN